jgi:hypothetical protein
MRVQQKQLHILPDEVVARFAGITTHHPDRDGFVKALRERGWTLESIAHAAGQMSRERVRQVCQKTSLAEALRVAMLGYPIPEPPFDEIIINPPPVYVEPSSETLARLLELKPLARQVRSSSPRNREAAEEYTALLQYAHEVEGVPVYRLAKRLGVTHAAIQSRLVRYGYRDTSGTSGAYQRIAKVNRATM